MTTLSVDEIRVAAVALDAAVPSLLDQYATADVAADAAARRGLVARGLLTDDNRLDADLATLLAPLTAPREVLEVEAVGPRAAQVRDPAGRVTSLLEAATDVWDVVPGAVLDTRLDVTVATLTDRPAADGGPLTLPVDTHLALLDLLGSTAAVEGFLVHHLGADGRRLADAFGPAARAGRVIRTVRDGDVVTVVRTGWLDGPGGVWRVDEGDPDDLDAHTRFVPCSGAAVAERVAEVRDASLAVAA